MTDPFLCVMAGYDDQTNALVQSMWDMLKRAGYPGTQTKNIPPHITLGTFPLDREAAVCELVRQAALETRPFDLSCSHIGIFQGSGVLFIAPDINRPLLNLKERFGDSMPWAAHTTLLMDEPRRLYDAVPIACQGFRAFRARVTTLHLYSFWPSRPILSCPLGYSP